VPEIKRESAEEIIGIDMGLKSFITLSDGKMIKAPKPLGANLKKLRRLQRHFSRQKKGGENWNDTKVKIGRMHYRISNVRKNFIHSLTDYLVRTYGGFVIEDLNIAGMIKNKHLSRHIADVGWFEFTRQLEYKCKDAGIALVRANTWYPSTKRYSQCGHVKEEMKLSERIYRCEICGLILDRDINAARNLANYLLVCSEEVTPAESHSKPRKRGTVKQEAGVA
jgi:putative transposase